MGRSEKDFALNGPVYEPLHFFPASFHRLALEENYDEAVSVLLVARCKARSCCLCDSCLDSYVPIDAEQLVRVDPRVCVFLFIEADCLPFSFSSVPVIDGDCPLLCLGRLGELLGQLLPPEGSALEVLC